MKIPFPKPKALFPPENRISNSVFLLIVILYISYVVIYPPGNIISWDVFGYYLYLPFTFLYNDMGIKNHERLHEIIGTYHNTTTFYQGDMYPNGNYVIRYSSGLAIMYSPSFLIGHISAKIFGYKPDGFSAPYQMSLLYGSLFYTLLGIHYLKKILLHYFRDIVTAIVLIIIVFGTNYFIHTGFMGHGAMSHNYLFTLYACLIWFTIKFYKTPTFKLVILLGLIEGLIVLTRPTEIVCILIPLLWGFTSFKFSAFKENINFLLKHKVKILIFLLVFIGVGSIQLFYWKHLTGEWFVNAYKKGNPGEGLEFTSPYILEFLFSFRKGWLIYTPVMVFAIVGLFFIKNKIREGWISIVIYFLCTLYIIASWSCWWYAASYSQRPMLASYPVLAIGLAAFIDTVLIKRKFILSGILFLSIFFLVFLNLFQSWQYFKGILDDSRMSFSYYVRIFGKTEATDEDRIYLLLNRPADGLEKFGPAEEAMFSYKYTLINQFEDDNNKGNEQITSKYFYSGNKSILLVKPYEYSPAIKSPYNQLTDKYCAWLRISCMIYYTTETEKLNAYLVATFKNREEDLYKYRSLDIKDTALHIEPNKWNKITMYYLTPEVRTKKDEFGFFFWNNSTDSIYVDDLKADIYEPRIDP